jgi:methylglutaconyl-CoA hydratase
MKPLLIDKEGPITTLTLNRPDKRNALSIELLESLCKTITLISEDPTQRVLILKGAGTVFCSGLDLEEASNPVHLKKSAALVARCLKTIHQATPLTIAAVQGAAIAGGAGIMSACDFVVAVGGIKIGYPEVRRGLAPALVMTFLRRQLRERDVRELLLTGRFITSERAKEIGLINYVSTPESLMDEVHKLAKFTFKGGPKAIAHTKRLINQPMSSNIDKEIDRALKDHLKIRHSPEAEEGIAAYLESREPRW